MTYLCKKCGSAIPLRRDLKPGEVVAGFEIEEELGRGAMGIVYQARQTNLDREVAIKILSDDSASDEVYVERFFREARAAASLSHPNVVQAYDAGVTDDGIYYFVMEKVTGENLDLVLNNLGPLNIPQALDVFLSVAGALAYAWTRNQLSHGDIKPDNIIMRLNGKIKLADFGLARRAKDADLADEDIRATPAYAPPEIIRGDKDVPGFKSDMYSFGATAYHVLIGHEPFVGTDPAKVCAMQLTDVQVPLSELNPNIPQRLSDLVDALMEKDPAKRPASWDEVVAELREIRSDLNAASAPKSSAAGPAPEKTWQKAVSHLLSIPKLFSVQEIVVAAAVLLMVVFIVVFICLKSCGKEQTRQNGTPSAKTARSASAPRRDANADPGGGVAVALPNPGNGTAGNVSLTEEQKEIRVLELRNALLSEAAEFTPEKAASLSTAELDRLFRSVDARYNELVKLDSTLPEPLFLPSQRDEIRRYRGSIASLQMSKTLGGTVQGGGDAPVSETPEQIRILELRNSLLDEAAAFTPEKVAAMSPAELKSLYQSIDARYRELMILDSAQPEPLFLPSQRETVRDFRARIAGLQRFGDPADSSTVDSEQTDKASQEEQDPLLPENARMPESESTRKYRLLLASLPDTIQNDSSHAEVSRMLNSLLEDKSFTDKEQRDNCNGIKKFLDLNRKQLLSYLAADKAVLRNVTLFPKSYPNNVLDDIDPRKRIVSLAVPGNRGRVGVSWNYLRNEEGEDQIIVTLINSPQLQRLSEDFREYLFVRALFLGVDPNQLMRRFDRASGLSPRKKAELNRIAGFFRQSAPVESGED